MEESIEELLLRSAMLLGKVPSKREVAESARFTQPHRVIVARFFLTGNTALNWNIMPIVDIYEPQEVTWGEWDRPIPVIHGHRAGELCAAPHFCHENTYRPFETDHPSFKEAFYQKWGYLYK